MRIQLDLFPAIVTVTIDGKEARTVSRTRVIVTDSVVLIAGDSATGPVLIFREQIVSADITKSKSSSSPSSVITTSGKALSFVKDENCGCGSRLRGWNPYGQLYSSKDPTE